MTKYRIVAVLTAGVLSACNSQPGKTQDEATSAPTLAIAEASVSATAQPANDEAAKAAITAEIARVIGSYRSGKASDFAHSPELDQVWHRALGTNQLDFDPLCSCQDYDPATFRHRMKSVEIDGNYATAKFDLDPGGGEWQATRLTFVRSRGDWLLDDIGTPNMTSIKGDMSRAAPGSYGIPVEQ